MAAIKRKKEKSSHKKTAKKSKKNVAKQRKPTAHRKKNAAALKIRKRNALRRVSLRGVRNRVISSRRFKYVKDLGRRYRSRKVSFQMGRQKMHRCVGCRCSVFLKALLMEVTNKRRGRWGAAAPKKRKRNSDNEVFYKMAEGQAQGSASVDADANASSESVPDPETLSQPITNEPPPLIST